MSDRSGWVNGDPQIGDFSSTGKQREKVSCLLQSSAVSETHTKARDAERIEYCSNCKNDEGGVYMMLIERTRRVGLRDANDENEDRLFKLQASASQVTSRESH